MFEIIASLLLISNLILIYFLRRAYRERAPLGMAKEVDALYRAVKKFEADGHSIIRIERINPDDVYLRNPQR